MDSDLEKILNEIDNEDPDEDGDINHYEDVTDNELTQNNYEINQNESTTEIDAPIKLSTPPPPIEPGIIPVDFNDNKFTVKGTKLWNTREPYFILINNEKLKENYDLLETSFFYIFKPAGKSVLESEVKKSLAKYLRNPSKNITESYKDFLLKLIISEVEKMCSFFVMDESFKNLFIYHLGPLNIYKIIIGRMNNNKSGICYRYTEDNRAVSFTPEEFIKDKVLYWFEENINRLSLPFDSLQNLNSINDIINKRYMQEKKKFLNRLNHLNSKLAPKKSITSKELLRLKGRQWFGFSNIFVYKRYIDKSIFENF